MSKIKKPRSAYNFYVKRWKTMSPDERAPFNQKAAEDKKRHDKEVYLEKKKNGLFNEEAGNDLWWAAADGDIKHAADALRQGADINYTFPIGQDDQHGRRMGILEAATSNEHTSMVRFLLSQPGIDVNLVSNYSTPLIEAVQVGGVDCVRLLLDMPEIDVNLGSKTPLMWSAILGHVDEVRLLLAHPNIAANIRDYEGRTALSWTEKPDKDNEYYKDGGLKYWLEEELYPHIISEGALQNKFHYYNEETLEKNRAICHDLIESFLVESRLVLNRVFKKKNIGSGVARGVGDIVSKRIHGLKPTTTTIVF